MKFILVVAVLAIVLTSTAGINGKNSGRKTMACRGDLNATAGCDKTCKKRCPGPKPEVCRCPKINSCMCITPYVYDPTVDKCVKRKDCAPPTTMEYTSTEVITTKFEESTKEDTTTVETTIEEENTTTECNYSKDITVNEDDCEDYTPEPITTTVGTTADCDDYDGTTIPQNITTETNDSNQNPCYCNCSDSDPTNTMECEDEATVDPTYCDGETTTECDNETTEEPINCDDETTTECADETTTECADETNTECVDETTTECADETTTECADETTTECVDETTTECADETTTECADETTTECIDETTTECADETTTECADETPTECADDTTTECADETTTECIDETTTECADETTTECADETTTKCDSETTEEPINCDDETNTECVDETTTECADETTTECADETTTECVDETTTECADETTTECADETTTECIDETTTECADETTTECADETPTECADDTTTECADETTTECIDETTTECADETTTECADETTTKCDSETTEEPINCDDETTTECADETTTECADETTTECVDETTTECNDKTTTETEDTTTTEYEDETTKEPTTTEATTTTEEPTTTEVTTTEAIPTLDKCPEALERFKIKLYALNLKFMSSYALTFPRLSFSGVVLAPTLLLLFLMKFLKEPYFMMLSQATGLNTISEIVCVCNSINNITYNLSPGLAAGVAIGVKSNYTFTSNAERFMKEVIIGKLLTFSSNSSLDSLNEAISKLTNNNISNVINNIDDSDQMVFLSGVSLDTMINSNKSVVKPFYEAPFKYAPANYTVVRGMYYYAECPNIQAKIVNISSKDGDYSLIIVLPYAPFTVQKHIEKTSAESLWACIQSMKPCLVNAEIPQINTNTTINTLKLLKYANISSSLTSTAEYKDMLVRQTRINLTKGRQRATLQIRSAESSHDHVQQVYNVFERQCFFVANTPFYQFVSWSSLGQMPVYGSVVASFAPGRQTSPSDD